MVQIQVSDEELAEVRALVQGTGDGGVLRRALAISWLASGVPLSEVARRLCVTRPTVYNWVERFQERADLDAVGRLADAERSGRPRAAAGRIEPLIEQIFETDPRDLGYRQTVWTADLLVLYLRDAHHIRTSTATVKRAISRLGLIWKRPRYDLSLQPKTWRQAKGGSKGASKAGPGPSSSCSTR
jgi:transposase